MSSNAGKNISYTLFGESHGEAVGITVTGLPANKKIDEKLIVAQLQARLGGAVFNTPRQEKPTYEIVSGFFEGKTTGTPLTVLFRNTTTRSNDYSQFVQQPRPGHADTVASAKYQGAQDYRGGGHFSGRLTTPLVFLGEVARQIIVETESNYEVLNNIASFGDIVIESYHDVRSGLLAEILKRETKQEDVASLINDHSQAELIDAVKETKTNLVRKYQMLDPRFPVMNEGLKEALEEKARITAQQKDSLGGVIETVVFNPPVSIGEPYFASIESVLSQLLFSLGSVKGVGFGLGDDFQNKLGSEVKDEILALSDKEEVVTLYNYNGGINGGISNGDDIVFQTVLKPIASILQPQMTLNIETGNLEELTIKGRHDATIINRVIPVINAVTHIAVLDLMMSKKSQEV